MTAAISDATDADRPEWNAFVHSQPSGTFYHLYEWRGIVAQHFAHDTTFLIARESGRVVGVLPLVMVSSRLFGRILCSVPFMNYGGPCAVSDEVTVQLVNAAVERSRALGADYLELRCADPVPAELPVSHRKISMMIPLGPDPDVLWNAFTAKHRKNVRRAYKNSLTFRAGGIELLDEFFAVLERSWRDLGTPLYRIDYFRSIWKHSPMRPASTSATTSAAPSASPSTASTAPRPRACGRAACRARAACRRITCSTGR